MTNDELLDRQAALQAEANAVLADLNIFGLLSTVGRPVQTGSSALGLMVARDIDVTTLCPTLATGVVFDLGRELAEDRHVRGLTFRNDTGRWNTAGRYPDGLYWMVDCVAESGVNWKLDLWFLAEGTTQFDLEHLRTLPPRLTDEARVAILRIKEARRELPDGVRGPSYDVYAAVLDHGVRTPQEFEAHLARAKEQYDILADLRKG